MAASRKLVVGLGIAVVAMTAFAPAAQAPQTEFTIRAYISGQKKFFPDPIMGIRGEPLILRPPSAA